MRTLGAHHHRRPGRIEQRQRTRPHSCLELRVRVRVHERWGGANDVPVPAVHSGELLHGFDGLLKREDVKVSGEVCRIDNVYCEGTGAG
jgi:hypothetical protein